MKVKYLILDIFLITSLFIVAIVLNVSFSHILKNNEQMIEMAKTQNEIAKMLGISRSYVSRIETKAINKLSKEFQE